MEFNINAVKKHPVITAGVVILGGLVFYFVYSANSSGAAPSSGYPVVSGGSTAGPTAADLQSQQIQGQLAALGIQSQTQLAIAQMSANSDAAKMAYQLQIAQLQAGVEAAHDLHEYDLAKFQTNAQLEAIHSQYESSLAQAQINASTQLQVASLNTDLTKFNNAINAQLQQSMLEQNSIIAKYNAQAAEASAASYASAARAQASASKTSSYAGVVIALASLFCDVNIKSVSGCVDSSKCLLIVRNIPLDYWNYIEGSTPHSLGDCAQHIGTYAQDFYRAIGVSDWQNRRVIQTVDMFGVLIGAIKALEVKV